MDNVAAVMRLKELEAQARMRANLDSARLEADYRAWLSRLIPKHFRNPDLALQFASHHEQFFDWGWDWTAEKKPGCLWIVTRGGNKSTSVAGLAVGLGARKKRKYGLVITRTETQGDTHVRRVNSMLLGSNVGQLYPGMARPEVHDVGNRKVSSAWNRTQLTTGDGWTLQSFSLLASLRGVGLEEYRPDFIWITDIDDEHDSVGMVETLLGALSASVLASMASDCMVIFDQNLIHRGSVMNRIYTRQTDVLSDRETVGPVPALYDITEKSYVREHERWRIITGRPSWPGGMPLAECEAKLNLWGKETWEREAQHNLSLAYADAVYSMWDERQHVITWSEFAKFFGDDARNLDGSARLPAYGKIGFCIDWGNNHKHPCAIRWAWWPEIQPLADSLFFFHEMCWPRFPKIEDDERAGPSPVRVGKAVHAQESAWDEKQLRRTMFRLSSHERPEIVEGFRVDLPAAGIDPLMCEGIDTAQAREGILHMQSLLTLIQDEPHPFRRYPVGHLQANQPLMGRPRCYFIVADGQGELEWNGSQMMVKPATDEKGMARTRFEYPLYRKPDTSEGAEKKDAPKLNDDQIDCDRAITARFYPSIQPLTLEQRHQLQMRIWGYDMAKATNANLNDPMWWWSRELSEARLRNQTRLENKTGIGQWDALEEAAEQRELRQGLPEGFWE